MPQFTLEQLAEKLGARIHGDGDCVIHAVATLQSAETGQISFLANSKYRSQLATTAASAVILSEDDLSACQTNALVMVSPYEGYARVAQLLDTTPRPANGIAPTAVIADDVELADDVHIGANTVIESGVSIGQGTVIGPNCFVGSGARLGDSCVIWANVTLYHRVILGAKCQIHSGAIIGADGFGYAPGSDGWVKIPQLGKVVLGDRVEIGANTTIDRGALDDTVLGNGVIIDNQCQIAHNVVIGDNTAIAGCTVLAGSTSVGKNCTIGGACGVNGHMEIVDDVHITGFTMVIKSITEPGVYSSGMPSMTNRDWRKTMVRFRQLDSMHQRIRELESIAGKDE